MRSLEDIVKFNNENGEEGGLPNQHPAFQSGQDSFDASLATKGIMDETYWQALNFCHKSTREDGIDAALHNNGKKLTALLVPPFAAQSIAAQAGYPIITLPAGVNPDTGMPFGLGLMGTAWSESTLIHYASAIEDLQLTSKTQYKRTSPKYFGYREKNLPVNNV